MYPSSFSQTFSKIVGKTYTAKHYNRFSKEVQKPQRLNARAQQLRSAYTLLPHLRELS